MNLIDVVAGLLRYRLYWLMGRDTILVKVKGRKSGRMVQFPVNINRDGADFWVISSRDRVWWRNLQSDPTATLWLGGQTIGCQGRSGAG